MKKLGKNINLTKETFEAYASCGCGCTSGCGGDSTPATYYAMTGIYTATLNSNN